MIRKILILGSSHVAALKAAAEKVLSRYPDVKLDFFAAPGPVYRKFKLAPQERLVGILEDTDAKNDEIALVKKLNGAEKLFYGDHDAVILVGHDIQETLNARILSRFAIDETSHNAPKMRLSRSAYLAMLSEIAIGALPDKGWWHSDAPKIFVYPAPRISEDCIHVGTRTVASWVPLVEKKLTTPEIFMNYIRILEQTFREIGITFISQPEDSFGETGLTRTDYSEGAIYIRPGDHRTDYDAKHMNVAFGEISLDRLLHVVTSNPVISTAARPNDLSST